MLPMLLAAALSTQAQIMKGDTLLGGNISFSSGTGSSNDPTNPDHEHQSYFSFSPSVGKAVKDNLLAGFDLLYAHSSSSSNDGSTGYSEKINTYGAGVFLRWYKYLGANFSIFGQGRLGGTYSDQRDLNSVSSSSNADQKTYNINLGFYPGLAYAISNRFQVEMGLQNLVAVGYSHTKQTLTDANDPGTRISKNNSFSASTGLGGSLQGFVIGFKVLLGPVHHS